MNISNVRRGFTLAELLVYLFIFGIFLGLIIMIFPWMSHSESSVKRLDLLHQLRYSSFQISEQVSYATGIIFPPEPNDSSIKEFHQLVFRNSVNEVVCMFLNKKGQLVLFNQTKKNALEKYITILTTDTLSFTVKRPAHEYIEYVVKIQEIKKGGAPGKEFILTNGVRLKNVLK